METYISMLRGINVTGKNKLPMAELKLLYEKLKCRDIITYIQSGNVVFKHSDAYEISKKVENQILKQYGYNVPVAIRTIAEIEKVLKTNPFLKGKNVEPDRLYVTFLLGTPEKEHLEKTKAISFDNEYFSIIGNEIYLHVPQGYGNAKLSNNFFESKLKVKATTRNWRTVNELLRIAKEI